MSEPAVSAVLIKVQDSVQSPMYYVSKTLVDSKTRYLPLDKETVVLLLGPYGVCVDRASLAVLIEEVKLYGEDSLVGYKTGVFRC